MPPPSLVVVVAGHDFRPHTKLIDYCPPAPVRLLGCPLPAHLPACAQYLVQDLFHALLPITALMLTSRPASRLSPERSQLSLLRWEVLAPAAVQMGVVGGVQGGVLRLLEAQGWYAAGTPTSRVSPCVVALGPCL